MEAPIYVPIVKTKRNDIASLSDVDPAKRREVRPLLELAEYESTDNDLTLHVLLKTLSVFTWPLAPYMDLYSFLPDARVSSGINATVAGFRLIAARGLSVIPTYGFERNDSIWKDLGAVANELGTGFCFRIDIEDLDDQAEQTWSEVIERSAEMGLASDVVDVVIDLRFVGAAAPRRLADLIHGFLELRQRDFKLRSITIAGSSALKTVSAVPVDGTLSVIRQEILLWTDIQAQIGASMRIAFGDYGVIHPDFSQSAPAKNAYAKIRYTRGDSIHYFRGTRLFPPSQPSNFGQYHALARRVIGSQQYRGQQYCKGDRDIWECANRSDRPGNLGTWVRIDQNHHIETTVDQLRQVITQLTQGAAAPRLIEVLQGA